MTLFADFSAVLSLGACHWPTVVEVGTTWAWALDSLEILHMVPRQRPLRKASRQ